MRVALDTNILAYAEGVRRVPQDELRMAAAIALIARLDNDEVVVPVQVFGELANVLRRDRRDAAAIAHSVATWASVFATPPTDIEIFSLALDLSARHRMQIWDAVILTAAAEAGCTLLLSEDMQDGFTWRSVTVANPFAATPHSLLRPYIPPT